MHPGQLQALMMQRHAQLRAHAEEVGDAHRELRRWEEEMGRRDEALRQRRRERVRAQRQEEAAKQEGASAEDEALRAEGNDHYRRGAFEDAIVCYDKCLALDSRSVPALSNRAMARLKLQRHGLAIQDATAALALDPNHTKSLERRAAALLAQGRREEARLDLEACVRLRPDDGVLQAKLRRLVEEMDAGANE